MNNSEHISESLETIFWVKILKFFDADPVWEKFGSGINNPDPQQWLRVCRTLTCVTLVQLSGQVWSPHTPSEIMGSMVKQWPGFMTPTALFLA